MASFLERAHVVKVIVTALMPYIGPAVARAAVLGHWEKLQLGTHAKEHEIDRLLAELEPGMNVFVGRKKTGDVIVGIKGDLRKAVGT